MSISLRIYVSFMEAEFYGSLPRSSFGPSVRSDVARAPKELAVQPRTPDSLISQEQSG